MLGSINLYRHFVRTARLLPSASESANTLQRIRDNFKEHRNVKDTAEIDRLTKDGESRLRFLKTKARRSAYYRRHKVNVHVMIDGDRVVETENGIARGKELAYHKDKRIDVDSVKRHHKLIRRQHFIDKPPVR